LSFVLYLVFGLFGFGISPHASADSAPTIQISTTTAQPLRFGIDAERLWYWYPAIGPQLAEIGVKQLNAAYVRVAINCAYEREEGVKDPSAYDDILSMMADMKKASPGIKFFATPRPLAQAYTAAETEAIFGVGGSVPWTMYPGWISGIKQLGGTTFDVQKLIQYFADYLNFMHAHGFDIDYMDISNEKQDASPADMALIHNTLPGLLDPGVKMPLIIAPSTWSPEQGTAFLNSLSTAGGQDKAFEIASTHNTGADTFLEDFAAAARRLDKESWNTEMHNWTGTNQAEDITNSAIFWNHLAAGFTGIDTWLFYGSAQESSKTVLGRQVNTYRNTADGSFVVTAATQTGMLATIAIAGVDTFEMRVDNGDAGIQTAPSLPCGNTPENTPDTQPVSKQNLPPADQIHTSNVLIIYNEADETPERNPDSLTTRYVSQIEAANIVLLNSDIPLQWNLVGVEKIPAYTQPVEKRKYKLG